MTQSDGLHHDTAHTDLQTKLTFALLILTAFMPCVGIIMAKTYAYIPAITGLIFFLLFWLWAGARPALSRITLIPIVTILIVSGLSILWSQYPALSSKQSLKLLALLPPQILLLSLFNTLNKADIRKYAIWIVGGTLVGAVLLFSETLTDGFVFNLIRGERPIPFTLSDLNRGAVTITLFAFISYAILSQRMHGMRAFAVIFIPAGVAVFFTPSQSAQLAMIAGVCTIFIFANLKAQSSIRIIRALKYALIILILIMPFIMTPLYNYTAAVLENNSFMAQGHAGHRLEIWDFISRYALEKNPLIGNGVGVTRSITDFESRQNYAGNGIFHPHNFALQIWIEFGVMGILIAAGMIYGFFTIIQTQLNLQQQRVIIPVFIATLVPASIAYATWQGLWLGLVFHIAALTLMVANSLGDDEKNAKIEA